jgi:uncharacterized protein Usg
MTASLLPLSSRPLLPNGIAKLQVFFYLPDHPLLVAPPFLWETADHCPEFPRVHRFLRYWHKHLDAAIQEVILVHPLLDPQDPTKTFEIPSIIH